MSLALKMTKISSRRSTLVKVPDPNYGLGRVLERTPIIEDMQKTAEMLDILRLLREIQPHIRRKCPAWCLQHLTEVLARLGDEASRLPSRERS